MAFIANREKNFEKYLLNNFGISLPKEVEIFYANGIRIGNRDLKRSHIHGDLGYAACDAGFNPTNSFIQNFGYLATRNVVELDEKQAREFAVGRGIGKVNLGKKDKYVIVKYGNYIIGLGQYSAKENKIKNKIPEKRRRKIIN